MNRIFAFKVFSSMIKASRSEESGTTGEQCAQHSNGRKRVTENRAAKEGQTQTGSLPDSPSLHTLKLFQTSSPGVGKGFDGGFLAAPSEAPYAICHRALRNSGSH